MIKKFLVGALLWLGAASTVFAQTGVLQPGEVWANVKATPAPPSRATLSQLLDAALCNTVNSIPKRTSSWVCTTIGSMATQNSNAVAITGGTITGLPNPAVPSDAANKAYVDSFASGIRVLAPSRLGTAAVLPNTPVYANGASGVGRTLTAGSNSTLTVDGTIANLNDVILVKDQASAFQNGIYTVTAAGSGGAPWVLTGVTYFDQAAEMVAGAFTSISAGATNINVGYALGTAVTTVGTDPVTFNRFQSPAVTSIVCNGGTTTITTSGTCASREVLAADRTYYVRVDGNDGNSCVVNSAGGACLTHQGAQNKALLIDANGHNITFQIGNGTYTAPLNITTPILNAAQVVWTGDVVTPSNVVLSTTSADAIYIDGIPACLRFQGMKTVTTTGGGHFNINHSSCVYLTGLWEFGASASYHMQVASGSSLVHFANYTISGSAVQDHHHVINGGQLGADGQTITLTGTPNFGGAFLGAAGASFASYTAVTFSGTATGTRYNIHGESYVKTANASPSTFLPGSIAGTSDGGNLDDDTGGGAWLPFNGTPTPAAGAMTATYAGRYKSTNGSGGKTVTFHATISITAAGSGTGEISFTSPKGIAKGAAVAAARDTNVTGATGTAFMVDGTQTFRLDKYDGTTMINTGSNIEVSGSYEINWLMKRDLDPEAANDNAPAFMNLAA